VGLVGSRANSTSDYHVSFTPEEIKSGRFSQLRKGQNDMDEREGVSAFYKDKKRLTVFHTYRPTRANRHAEHRPTISST